MKEVEKMIMEGIKEKEIDLSKKYNEEEEEKIVIKGDFKKMIEKGQEGIEVGMEKNIKKNNVEEI